MKQHIRVRLTSLPQHLDAAGPGVLPNIGSIRCKHAEQLVTVRWVAFLCVCSIDEFLIKEQQVAGTVVRAGVVQMLEAQRMYECSRCHHRHASPLANSTGPACCGLVSSWP